MEWDDQLRVLIGQFILAIGVTLLMLSALRVGSLEKRLLRMRRARTSP